MKFVAISDTHGQHHQLTLPSGDVLIHAGDIIMNGSAAAVLDFLDWFTRQGFKHKIFIAGNHDFYFEKSTAAEIAAIIPGNVVYLNDSGVTINDIYLWGSPISPWFFNWAFNRRRGDAIQAHWNLIPPHTNILITHGPAVDKSDSTISGRHVGCSNLADRVNAIKPAVHICGHIHEAYGELEHDGTRYCNASVLNKHYKRVNPPLFFDY